MICVRVMYSYLGLEFSCTLPAGQVRQIVRGSNRSTPLQFYKSPRCLHQSQMNKLLLSEISKLLLAVKLKLTINRESLHWLVFDESV